MFIVRNLYRANIDKNISNIENQAIRLQRNKSRS